MAHKNVLLIGIDPDLIDFSASPGRNADQIKAAGNAAVQELTAAGYEAHNCLTDLGETAEATVSKALLQTDFDVILIGAGIRALPQNTILFEKIINKIHQLAPGAKLCFNSNPNDTVEAVKRWI
ncbi:hypothetical protein HDF24_00825 [Mucilaginibacter sp. X4EP1]|uniref:hypothetical protein n=1 Tax=Mucilaginibacter sp. X4EP1 TaxID=2723092 RepID=UPI0021693EF6|nr:hypothetical protein [Mucilaginibacter sp. X4EP1]MCS3811555.1 putative Rossmann fold enzyme [Mucilaginibacter sp. X4EP1]